MSPAQTQDPSEDLGHFFRSTGSGGEEVFKRIKISRQSTWPRNRSWRYEPPALPLENPLPSPSGWTAQIKHSCFDIR